MRPFILSVCNLHHLQCTFRITKTVISRLIYIRFILLYFNLPFGKPIFRQTRFFSFCITYRFFFPRGSFPPSPKNRRLLKGQDRALRRPKPPAHRPILCRTLCALFITYSFLYRAGTTWQREYAPPLHTVQRRRKKKRKPQSRMSALRESLRTVQEATQRTSTENNGTHISRSSVLS